MDPPDLPHVTATPVLSPADVRPYAANWICWAGATVRLSGRMTIWTTGAGPLGAANRSQTTPTTASGTHRPAARAASLCLNARPASPRLAPHPLGGVLRVVDVTLPGPGGPRSPGVRD